MIIVSQPIKRRLIIGQAYTLSCAYCPKLCSKRIANTYTKSRKMSRVTPELCERFVEK